MQPILEIKHLRKVYKDTVAVGDVSFSVQQGSVFGLLGPNGAGKTTTMEVIEGIIPATSGDVLYRGLNRDDSFREEVGIQFQHTSLLNFLTVEQTLTTFQALYTDPENLDTLVELCNLESILTRHNNKLSGGQLQRLMLALALINKPHLIFLDEPSTGLDPQSRRNLWAIVEKIKAEGKTIILTTHSMEEAEYLCDMVAIMDRGQIIAMDSPHNLVHNHCHKLSIILPTSAFPMELHKIPFPWKQSHSRIEIETNTINEQLSQLIDMGVNLAGLVVHNSNLEDVFLHLTGRQLRE